MTTQAEKDAQTPRGQPTKYISLEKLFENNRKWAEEQVALDPDYFSHLAQQQSPQILWIGCSDSRVPANQILALEPGEVFVHRNIANVVLHTDLNCLSVLSYAIEVLKVRHVIVCGHYGCGGVKAAEGKKQYGLIDNWLRHIKDVYTINRETLEQLPPGNDRSNLLCELNVARSVANVCHTTILQNAWRKGQQINVQGWVYSLDDGYIRALEGLNISSPSQLDVIFQTENELAHQLAESVHDRGVSALSQSTSSPGPLLARDKDKEEESRKHLETIPEKRRAALGEGDEK